MNKDPFDFKPLSAEERRLAKEEKERIEQAVRNTIEVGQECLSSDLFRKYEQEYERMERALIDIGVNTTVTDPNHYNALCRMIFSNLKVCRLLIKNVRRDALGK